MRPSRSILVGLVLFGFAAEAHAGLVHPEPATRWRVSLLPIGRVATWLTAPFESTRPREPVPTAANMTPIQSTQGWEALHFPVALDGFGVYLAVEGEVEFDVAYIDYADGDQDRVALGSATCRDGLFALREFAGSRSVPRVSILARALSPRAEVGVLLGR